MCEHQVQDGGPEASRGMSMPDASELSYGPDHSVLGLDEMTYTREASGSCGETPADVDSLHCQV